MYMIVLVFALLGTSLAHPIDEWEKFKNTHNKVYKSIAEEAYRRAVFNNTLNYIKRHNEKAAQGYHTYTLGINEFADMDYREFKNVRLGYQSLLPKISKDLHEMSGKDAPTSMDWRSKNVVAPVKDQGQCGSCWAFSAVGSTESALAIKTGKLIEMSEQDLVDCSGAEGNMGCNGGLMDQAFEYMEKKGIDSEKSYPYEARDDTCRYNEKNVVTKVKSYKDIPTGDEASLLDAVAHVGPVSVAVDATYEMQMYQGGILDDQECSASRYSLNHGIVVVGYGTENGQDYWIVRNSWGAAWGESGYLRMKRGINQCGIATDASYPIL